jgi:hypothetical protein
MPTLRIFVASPQDAENERMAAARIIHELSQSECTLEPFLWEWNVPPGFRREHIQSVIDREGKAEQSDIVVVIFRQRIGTPLGPGEPTGTLHEFELALRSWLARERPWIMVYFDASGFTAKSRDQLDQYDAVQRFKFSLREQGRDCREFNGLRDFERKFHDHLEVVARQLAETVGKLFSKDDYDSLVFTGDKAQCLLLSKARGIYSSFRPDDSQHPFRRVRLATTPGWVPDTSKSENALAEDHEEYHHIYVLRDPIRPFEIQIGEFRATRWGHDPREVPFEGLPSRSELKRLYPLLINPQHRWLRMVLAELISDPAALNDMVKAEEPSKEDPSQTGDPEIRKVIARNPSAPDPVKARECIFCKQWFQNRGVRQAFSQEAILKSNDFPFGPFFHYIVFPREAIHAWDRIREDDLFQMNWLVHQYLTDRQDKHSKTIFGATGVRFGFNSSIRHLVLGRRTRTSAGASVPHVHKQVWGMGAGSVNLADHLRDICIECERRPEGPQDYLGEYLKALDRAKMVIWSDDNVVVFVPFGQIALHELQIMIKRKPTRTFLDLSEAEVQSLSRAEYIVARLYGRMDINSFNEIMLSLPFSENRSKTFRLIFTFITREVDLAVSELSLLYVVDKHPSDTVMEINKVWPSRRLEDLR